MKMYENEVLRQLHARKSVRVYEDKPVSREVKEALLEAALAAPTAGCMCLYTILDITDEAIKQRLSVLCDNQPFIGKAPIVLVFLADWQRWRDSFALVRGGKTRPAGEGDLLLAAADALIAAQNVVVAAEALGLGSCYIGDIIEQQAEIAELLCIPPQAVPVAMLCIGYPTQKQREREKPPRFRREAIVHTNRYSLADESALHTLFAQRHEKGDLDREATAMAARKWEADFMEDMNSSARRWIARFCGRDAK